MVLCAGAAVCVTGVAAGTSGTAFSPLAAAGQEAFWSFLRPGQPVAACEAGSAALPSARARLADLSRRLERLADDAPVAPVLADLHALLKTACFQIAAEAARIPKPDSILSLKAWWSAGGADWLESYVEPADGAAILVSSIVIPPDTRRTLTLDGQPGHPLRALLCTIADTSCGSATNGWRARAEAYFELYRQVPARTDGDERPAADPAERSAACAKSAAGTGAARYRSWRDCLDRGRPRTAALPLGRFKSPDEGWLFVGGRRGHYSFCDTTRAYDLATGTALSHDSCSELVLKRGGRVDGGATDRGRAEHIRAGTVPVANLREAVWMMLLRSETEAVQLHAEYHGLPPDLARELAGPPRPAEWDGMGAVADTGQTRLVWRWLAPGGEAIAGDITWPASYEAAEDHAVKLLNVAEQGFVESCVRQLPPAIPASSKTVRLDDVEAGAVDDLDQSVAAAQHKWKTAAVCGAPR